MAITNKAIIELYKSEQGLPVDYPLYTWAVWHSMGYRVRKGEKCKHRVTLWKHTERKIEQGGQEKTDVSIKLCRFLKCHKLKGWYNMKTMEYYVIKRTALDGKSWWCVCYKGFNGQLRTESKHKLKRDAIQRKQYLDILKG